jgi:hypothetical protein
MRPAASLGSPSGQLAGCAPRIAYLDIDHQLHLMTYADGAWTDRGFADVRGAAMTSDDPDLFTDARSVMPITYRGVDGRLLARDVVHPRARAAPR